MTFPEELREPIQLFVKFYQSKFTGKNLGIYWIYFNKQSILINFNKIEWIMSQGTSDCNAKIGGKSYQLGVTNY
jgi:hypothetical protein